MDRARLVGHRDLRQFSARRPEGLPAAVHEHRAAVGEMHRRQHVYAGPARVDAVIEQELVFAVVLATGEDACITRAVGRQAADVLCGVLAREISRERAFFRGAPKLPVAEHGKQDSRGDGRQGRGKARRKSQSARIQHRAILRHPGKRGGIMSGVKWLVLAIFFMIVLSLVSAMVQLVRDNRGETRRMVRALTVRIGLSIALFIVLWATWKMGWIEPHGVGG